VGRGFSRDIKNCLSQTLLSAAFSPSFRLVARPPRSLGRAPCIALWVAASCPEPSKGSRDIKNCLSQTFFSAAFSPSLRLVARPPRTFHTWVRRTPGVGRKSRPTASSDTISNRFWSKSRSYRKQTIKPCLPGSRIAYQAIAARSAT
jgi:hypothetical protein